MRKMSGIILRAREAVQDLNLLHLLWSEIHYELSSNRYQVLQYVFLSYMQVPF